MDFKGQIKNKLSEAGKYVRYPVLPNAETAGKSLKSNITAMKKAFKCWT